VRFDKRESRIMSDSGTSWWRASLLTRGFVVAFVLWLLGTVVHAGGGLAVSGLLTLGLVVWFLAKIPAVRRCLGRAVGWLPAIAGLALPGSVLPIGLEDTRVRRHPWVTYSVILLCFAVFQAQLLSKPGEDWDKAFDAKWEEHWDYFGEHPYLQISRFMFDRLSSRQWNAVKEVIEAYIQNPWPGEGTLLEDEQSILDAKAAELEALMMRWPAYRFGRVPARGDWWTFLSSVFMHGGWMHLLGNLLFFFVSAPVVEDAFGRVLFAVLYLGSGVAGGLLALFKNPESTIPSIGASGAIAGVMGAFLIRFGARKIHLLLVPTLWFPLLRLRFSVPAYIVLPPWIAMQFWNAHQGYIGVGWWAHIGGFVFGAAFAFVMFLARVEARVVDPGVERRITLLDRRALDAAIGYRVEGKLRAAKAAIASAIRIEPHDPDVRYEAYLIAVEAGDDEDAAARATDLMRSYSAGPVLSKTESIREMEALVDHIIHRLGHALSPAFYLVTGGYFEEKVELAAALDVYQALIDRRPADPSVPRALIRQARVLDKLGDPSRVREKLHAARAHAACSAAEREAIGRRLAQAPTVTNAA